METIFSCQGLISNSLAASQLKLNPVLPLEDLKVLQDL